MVSSCFSPFSSTTTATVSSTVKAPDWMDSTVPFRLGGTMILWSTTLVSWTVPSTSPPMTLSPGLATAVKSHFFSRSRAGTSTPRGRLLLPAFFRIPSRGRWMPS